MIGLIISIISLIAAAITGIISVTNIKEGRKKKILIYIRIFILGLAFGIGLMLFIAANQNEPELYEMTSFWAVQQDTVQVMKNISLSYQGFGYGAYIVNLESPEGSKQLLFKIVGQTKKVTVDNNTYYFRLELLDLAKRRLYFVMLCEK